MASPTNPFATGGQLSTAASPFGNTTNQPATAANGQAAPALDSQTQHVPEPLPDINSPELTSESLTAKEGDAFAAPPPPPDGIYRVKLKLRGVKQEDVGANVDISQYLAGGEVAPWVPAVAKDRNGNPVGTFAKTIMDVQIIDPNVPELDGEYLQVPYKWIDTRLSRRGLSKVMTILTIAGNRPDGQPWLVLNQTYGHKSLIETFVKFLAGEPEIMCQSEWSASCDVCGKAADAIRKAGGSASYPKSVDGMTNFKLISQAKGIKGQPGYVDAVYSPDMLCRANAAHGTTKARAMAVQFFALDSHGKK
jgi:hypothetical protein